MPAIARGKVATRAVVSRRKTRFAEDSKDGKIAKTATQQSGDETQDRYRATRLCDNSLLIATDFTTKVGIKSSFF